jgi:hypothetical protein
MVASSKSGLRGLAMETSKVYDFDPNNLPQEILQAIGLMTTCAAQTESVVEMAIACFLDIDVEYGQAVTTHMAMPLRISALLASAEIRIDDLDVLDELDQIVDTIEDAFKRRNGVVHHNWCRDPETEQVFTVKDTARTRVETSLIPMAVDHIKSEAAFVYQAGMSLMTFLITQGFTQKLPPIERIRHHKSKAMRKKRRERKLRVRDH